MKRHHGVPVRLVRFDGAESARPAPAVLEAISSAQRLVIAPSNPVVLSIRPWPCPRPLPWSLVEKT